MSHVIACPRCGYPSATCAVVADGGQRPPQPGDFAICARCGGLNVMTQTAFAGELGMRRATPEETQLMESEPLMVAARELIRQENGRHAR